LQNAFADGRGARQGVNVVPVGGGRWEVGVAAQKSRKRANE